MSAPAREISWDRPPGHTFVKICGLTDLADARAAVAAGADAVGFVFAPSPRRVTPEAAAAVVGGLSAGVARVGVFVDAPVTEVLAVADEVGLDAVQLQGDEGPLEISAIQAARPGLFVIRAVRLVNPRSFQEGLEGTANALMVDSKDARQPEVAQGALPVDWLKASSTRRLMVAGGLTPETVGSVVAALSPWGVDVSAGVESSPGRKDHQKMTSFVAAVRSA